MSLTLLQFLFFCMTFHFHNYFISIISYQFLFLFNGSFLLLFFLSVTKQKILERAKIPNTPSLLTAQVTTRHAHKEAINTTLESTLKASNNQSKPQYTILNPSVPYCAFCKYISYGQLYVSISRVTSRKGLKILITNEDGEDNIVASNSVTKNFLEMCNNLYLLLDFKCFLLFMFFTDYKFNINNNINIFHK